MDAGKRAARVTGGPLLEPDGLAPSDPRLEVIGAFNPGATLVDGSPVLLVRVAERPTPIPGQIGLVSLEPETWEPRVAYIPLHDPDLKQSDPRAVHYRGALYYTSLSHFRIAEYDGARLSCSATATLMGRGRQETYGVEDCRIVQLEERYYITYTALSMMGPGVALASTADWRNFERHGLVLLPPNKSCVLFPEQIGGLYYALHRPSGRGVARSNIWVASSPDLTHWGGYAPVAEARPGEWDTRRIGAGPPPIRYGENWLLMYYGVNRLEEYAVGAIVLDGANPGQVLARSRQPFLVSEAAWERSGFVPNVVFPSGLVLWRDEALLFYGAGDRTVGAATVSLDEVVSDMG